MERPELRGVLIISRLFAFEYSVEGENLIINFHTLSNHNESKTIGLDISNFNSAMMMCLVTTNRCPVSTI
jgi:hypothetical protein